MAYNVTNTKHREENGFFIYVSTKVKAKFHYAGWFGAGSISKLVADRFEAKFHYAM